MLFDEVECIQLRLTSVCFPQSTIDIHNFDVAPFGRSKTFTCLFFSL